MPYQVQEDDEVTNISYSSSAGVNFQFKAKGEALAAAPSLPKAAAGVVVAFDKGSTVAFSAVGCKTHRIKDIPALESQIFDLFDRYQWERNWVVVTHAVVASSATILLAQDGGARVELTTNGELAAPAIPAGIASLGGSFSLAASYNMETTFVSEKAMTPLFRASRVKGWLFTGVKEIGVQRLMEPIPEGQEIAPLRRGAERPGGSILETIEL